MDHLCLINNSPTSPPTTLACFRTRPIEVNILSSSVTMRPTSIGMFEGPYDETLQSHEEIMEELQAVAPLKPPPRYRFSSRAVTDYGDNNNDSSSEEEYPWLWDDACLLHHPYGIQGTWTKILESDELKYMNKD